MTARFQIDASALDDLARQLRAAGVDLKDLEPAGREAGRVVETAAHPPRRTGKLATSSRVVVNAGDVTFASTARYWTFVHWGAPRRNMRARPWWRDAVQHSRDDVLKVYAAHAVDSLKQIG